MTYEEFKKEIEDKIFSQGNKLLLRINVNNDLSIIIYCTNGNYHDYIRIFSDNTPKIIKKIYVEDYIIKDIYNTYNVFSSNCSTYVISEELSKSLLTSPRITLDIIEHFCKKLKL